MIIMIINTIFFTTTTKKLVINSLTLLPSLLILDTIAPLLHPSKNSIGASITLLNIFSLNIIVIFSLIPMKTLFFRYPNIGWHMHPPKNINMPIFSL